MLRISINVLEDYRYYSTNASFVCEIIPWYLKDDTVLLKRNIARLTVMLNHPIAVTTWRLNDYDNNGFKWNAFGDYRFESGVPVLLIYKEKPQSKTIEDKINKLFASKSFINLKDKKKITESIRTVTDSFYMVSYNILMKNK